MGEPAAAVKPYIAKHRLQFLHLLDLKYQASRMLSVPASPTTFLISRAGQILGGALGYRDWASPEARHLLESVLADASVSR